LEQFVLTTGDRRGLVRAYHWETFGIALLVLAVLAPFWFFVGRAPAPLLFLESILRLHTGFDAGNAARGGSGLLTDAATAYLAAALALAASAWKGRFGWATVLAVAGTLAFFEVAFLCSAPPVEGAKCYVWVFKSKKAVEPAFTEMLWTVAVLYAAAAAGLAELALRFAAKRLDRLVCD
jgi:hypothetical protein